MFSHSLPTVPEASRQAPLPAFRSEPAEESPLAMIYTSLNRRLEMRSPANHVTTTPRRDETAGRCTALLDQEWKTDHLHRGFGILSQSTRHLQPAMDFLINAP
jgi:hypothetical protein